MLLVLLEFRKLAEDHFVRCSVDILKALNNRKKTVIHTIMNRSVFMITIFLDITTNVEFSKRLMVSV